MSENRPVFLLLRIITCPPQLTSSKSSPIGLLPVKGVIYKSSLSNVTFTYYAKTHNIYSGKVMAEKLKLCVPLLPILL